ncbi:MAG TPA: hypothetical protein VMA30_18085 [Xanthobacteraceae bacterium]|nr:hypothetical protein [Xanthobacteraceae bacterium]
MIRVVRLASLSVRLVAAAAAFLAVGLAVPAAAAAHHAKASAHNVSHPLYDMAPQGRAPVNSDDPSLTGGGSLGYNQNIYNW